MHLRRTALFAAAAVVAATLIAGCSSGSGAPAVTPPHGPAKGNVTFWSSLSGMKDVAAAFNASQKDITVTFEEIPNGANGGYTKLSAAISSGTGPDVAGIEYQALPGFVAADQLKSIDGLVPGKVLTAYDPEVRGQVSFAGADYALPYDAPPMVMWYRKDLLADAGVQVPKTWADFEKAARALKAVHPDSYLASFFTNEPQLAPLAWQAGSEWFHAGKSSWKVGIDDAASKKVADYWQRLIDEGLVKRQLGFSDEWTADLSSGAVAGWIGGSWSASGLKTRTEGAGQAGKWIAAVPPTWDGKPSASLSGGTSFAITKNSKNADAAAAFLTWLTTSPEAVRARGAVGTAYLAYPGLNDVAKAVAPTAYYGNDIYAVFGQSSKGLRPWAWGPSYDITGAALKNAVTSSPTLGDAVATTQSDTVSGLSKLGVSIAK